MCEGMRAVSCRDSAREVMRAAIEACGGGECFVIFRRLTDPAARHGVISLRHGDYLAGDGTIRDGIRPCRRRAGTG